MFRGSGLADRPRLVAPFAFQLEESAGNGSDGAKWKVRLAVDARTAVGVYPVRVVTDSGVSNPILFAVGQLPQVSEVEPNNTFDARSRSRIRSSSRGSARAMTRTSSGSRAAREIGSSSMRCAHGSVREWIR